MTKQDLWKSVYIEAMRQGRINDPKELADKAVKDYEERFERYTIPKIDIDNTKPDTDNIYYNSFIKFGVDKKDVHPSLLQAGRLKRLFEEFGLSIECHNDDEISVIVLNDVDVLFHFKGGEFKEVTTV